MTLEEIKAIAETWFDWPEEDRHYVTYTSAMLFARDMYEQGQRVEREKHQELIAAAEAVIARWETPDWEGTEPTDTMIYRMLDVIEKFKEKSND